MQNTKKITLTLSGIILGGAIFVVLLTVFKNNFNGVIPLVQNKNGLFKNKTEFSGLKKFLSAEEFKTYLNERSFRSDYSSGINTLTNPSLRFEDTMGKITAPLSGGGDSENMAQIPERVSGTNVQVFGVDEPDILKTDGSYLFYASDLRAIRTGGRKPLPLLEVNPNVNQSESEPKLGIMERPEYLAETLTVQAFPPDTLKTVSSIRMRGDLLLYKNMLAVFDQSEWNKRGIYGIDVSDKQNPVEKWHVRFEENTNQVQARLLHGFLYLVTSTYTNIEKPCPIIPFIDSKFSVPCSGIYYPDVQTAVDTVYTVSKINMETGKVEGSLSVLGSSSDSTVYMSSNALYVGYYYQTDQTVLFAQFIAENTDMFSREFRQKVEKLLSYDISQPAKQMELGSIISKLYMGMGNDERKVFENNMENRMKKFSAMHQREFEKTGIVKINVKGLSVSANGEVPGRLLNQFAMDEYQGNLRVASTIEGSGLLWRFGSSSVQVSDVTVLSKDLNTLGSVQNLGKTERIFGVRFIAERGYVVTFRQTDPLYVVDLSNSRSPKIAGELKIPGYSSYLHPLDNNLLLGVGMEDNKVKVSLFDVSNSSSPAEVDKFNLTDYWSEAVNNHHAFLADEKHSVFFMPGSQDGYIFSYADRKLTMVKAVTGVQAKRALFINDYLYVVGDSRITVFDELNWQKKAELDL